jgi:hypothetical protein
MQTWFKSFPQQVSGKRRNREGNIGLGVRRTIDFAAVQLRAGRMSVGLFCNGIFNLE